MTLIDIKGALHWCLLVLWCDT